MSFCQRERGGSLVAGGAVHMGAKAGWKCRVGRGFNDDVKWKIDSAPCFGPLLFWGDIAKCGSDYPLPKIPLGKSVRAYRARTN